MRALRARLGSLSFRARLTIISSAALALRVAFVESFGSHIKVGGDSVWYQLMSGSIVNNTGFVDPVLNLRGVSVPTAFRPPLYPVFLAGVAKAADGSMRTF